MPKGPLLRDRDACLPGAQQLTLFLRAGGMFVSALQKVNASGKAGRESAAAGEQVPPEGDAYTAAAGGEAGISAVSSCRAVTEAEGQRSPFPSPDSVPASGRGAGSSEKPLCSASPCGSAAGHPRAAGARLRSPSPPRQPAPARPPLRPIEERSHRRFLNGALASRCSRSRPVLRGGGGRAAAKRGPTRGAEPRRLGAAVRRAASSFVCRSPRGLRAAVPAALARPPATRGCGGEPRASPRAPLRRVSGLRAARTAVGTGAPATGNLLRSRICPCFPSQPNSHS